MSSLLARASLAVLVALLAGGCATRWTADDAEVVETIVDPRRDDASADNRRVLKVYVDATGIIHLDGAPASLDTLALELDQLADRRGVVWYYRDRPGEEPPPEVAESVDAVMQAVMDSRVTVELLEGGFDGSMAH